MERPWAALSFSHAVKIKPIRGIGQAKVKWMPDWLTRLQCTQVTFIDTDSHMGNRREKEGDVQVVSESTLQEQALLHHYSTPLLSYALR